MGGRRQAFLQVMKRLRPPSVDLGRYRLVAELGRGGMGVVYLARARGLGGFDKPVVVKVLRPELATDEGFRAMFLDEARLAARLSHPAIAQTFEVGRDGERYFMALELLEGSSLHHARKRLGATGPGAIPLRLSLRVLSRVLEALHHAHELTGDDGLPLGVVHRDVSPQNVFLTWDGQVKLIDFGVAKSRGRGHETRAGVLKGSIAYMSPDHVDGSSIDRRADVFAVGVILRELLTGERMWGDDDDVAILKSLITREIPPLAEGAAPQELAAIARRATAPLRADRFDSAASMRAAIDAYLEATDPRGSLAELGAMLAARLADERATFQALASHDRDAVAATLPAIDLSGAVSLPSSLLVTCQTAVSPVALVPPPGEPEARRRPARRAPAMWLAAASLFAVAALAGRVADWPRVGASLGAATAAPADRATSAAEATAAAPRVIAAPAPAVASLAFTTTDGTSPDEHAAERTALAEPTAPESDPGDERASLTAEPGRASEPAAGSPEIPPNPY